MGKQPVLVFPTLCFLYGCCIWKKQRTEATFNSKECVTKDPFPIVSLRGVGRRQNANCWARTIASWAQQYSWCIMWQVSRKTYEELGSHHLTFEVAWYDVSWFLVELFEKCHVRMCRVAGGLILFKSCWSKYSIDGKARIGWKYLSASRPSVYESSEHRNVLTASFWVEFFFQCFCLKRVIVKKLEPSTNRSFFLSFPCVCVCVCARARARVRACWVHSFLIFFWYSLCFVELLNISSL
jgi:hypothetical protein